MQSRRTFVKQVAGATAGMLVGGRGGLAARAPWFQAGRREVFVGGRRIRTVDIHTHCIMPEVMEVVKGTDMAQEVGSEGNRPPLILGPDRLKSMDEQGVDVEVLSINAYWYGAERALAMDIVRIQNETLSKWCAAHPDRFVGLASVALQYPELAADQLDAAVKKLGLRGVAIGGSVGKEELASRKWDPFWAKAEELGVLVYMHPHPAPGTTENERLEGKGRLGNVIGNPLETTVFFSHLIFEGTLDRFPGLRICGSHGGGFLPSYVGRSDALCARESGVDCRNLKKRPSEYFKKELFVDTLVFRQEALRHLVAECGMSQVLYGTDQPFDWPTGVDFVLDAPSLSDADKTAILGGNASRLLRIT